MIRALRDRRRNKSRLSSSKNSACPNPGPIPANRKLFRARSRLRGNLERPCGGCRFPADPGSRPHSKQILAEAGALCGGPQRKQPRSRPGTRAAGHNHPWQGKARKRPVHKIACLTISRPMPPVAPSISSFITTYSPFEYLSPAFSSSPAESVTFNSFRYAPRELS